MGETDHSMWDTVRDIVGKFVTDADLNGTLGWLVDRCAEMSGVSASALVLADRYGALEVVAASSEPAREMQEFETLHCEGPAQDSYESGARIDCPDLVGADTRWPRYAPIARRHGVRAVHAFPMPLPGRTIGALTLCLGEVGGLPDDSLKIGQTLVSTAALGVESHRATQSQVLVGQLQTALDSRILIEQAKGLLAERLSITPDDAFDILRRHARSNRGRLTDVATAILDGTLALTTEPSH
jgi:GAF domain-containing protein